MDYSQLGNDPIPGDSPVGINVRYEDSFEVLQGEIDKLSNPTAEGVFEWKTVVSSASMILQDQSKDLLVASYLSVGLVNLEGAKGLNFSTEVYLGLLSKYWEPMFPPIKRLRGRIAAIEWWIDKTKQAIEGEEPGPVSEEVASAIKARFEKIDTLLEKHVGDKVFLRPLIREVERYLAKGVPAESTSENATQVSGQDAPVAVAAPAAPARNMTPVSTAVDLSAPSVDLGAADQVHTQLKPIFNKIAQASKILRETSVTDAQSYAWLRFAVYGGLKNCPPGNADGKTGMAGPPAQLNNQLQALYKTGSWQELVHMAENALMNVQYKFWLDLNWYTAMALKQMNGCDEALKAVELGMMDVLDRLNGLEELCFSNELPFAAEDTRDWIQELKERETGGAGVSSGHASVMADPLDEVLEEAIQEARGIAENPKQIGAAVRVLEKQICSCESGKDALELRLIMLELLAKAKQVEPAAALGELILADVERFGLREWDVPLAVRCHLQVYNIYKKVSGTTYKEQLRDVYQRILSMSAADALSL